MRRQIRRRTFETNSSSTHAICITKDKCGLGTHIDFEVGEFGWENEEYSDRYSKASYLITAILSFDKDEADRRLQLLKDILDSNNITYTLPELVEHSWKYGGKTRYCYNTDGCYIDHSGETKEFLDAVLSDSDRLFRYLFGDSFIITGNDNDDEYSDRMYTNEGEEETNWGTYTNYGGLKPEFDNYEVYEKGN